jgi:polyhydroxybutyrate depolymerase
MSRSSGRDGPFGSRRGFVVAALAVLVAGCGGNPAGSSPTSTAPALSPAASAPASLPTASTPTASATTSSPAAGAPAAPPTDGRAVTSPSAPPDDPTADRPFDVFVPTSYTSSVPMPLVLLLHGISTSSARMESIAKLQPVAEERGFLYVHPDGTLDAAGDPFWNATDGCCNAYDAPVDDSAYLQAVIEQVQATYNVDSKRIYIVGVSNGGFMAYRMACDHADTIAAIASVAGATFLDATMCGPSGPVSVLQVHGTTDQIVPYDGGELIPGHPFPSAATTVADWAAYNRCGPDRGPTGLRLDLDGALPGDETDVSRFDGCPTGGAVELWTVGGADHFIQFTPAFTASVVDFLFAHPKP